MFAVMQYVRRAAAASVVALALALLRRPTEPMGVLAPHAHTHTTAHDDESARTRMRAIRVSRRRFGALMEKNRIALVSRELVDRYSCNRVGVQCALWVCMCVCEYVRAYV